MNEVEVKIRVIPKENNNNSECPFKHEFRKDCEEYAECDDCSKWAFCSVTFADEE